MKKFPRIFALLLTATLLLGVFMLVSSAETGSGTITDTGFSQDYENLAVGASVPNPGNGDASSTSQFKIDGDGNNKFVSYKYLKDIETSYTKCRRDLVYGDYTSNAANAATKLQSGELTGLASLSYFVIDFDISAQAYRYLVDVVDEETSVKTTVEKLSDSYPTEEGAYGIRLAYSQGALINLDNRPLIATESNGTVTYSIPSSSYNQGKLYFGYDEKAEVWKLYSNSALTTEKGVLSNVLGEWNHLTYIIEVDHDTLAYSYINIYLNGEYIHKQKIYGSETNIDKFVDIMPRAINWTVYNFMSTAAPNNYLYSMALDNLNSKEYSLDYSSGDKIGIDDLLDPNNTEVTLLPQCEDVTYNENYVLPYPNGYTEIDGDKYFLPYTVNKALKNIKNGAVIKTTMSITGLEPPLWTSATIKCDEGIGVTLSDNAIARGVTLKKTPTGYEVSSGIKANMSLFGDMRFNLYLPKLTGAEITSVVGAKLSSSTVTVQGMECYVVYATPEIDSFDAISATVNYTYDGQEKSLDVSLDPMSYATVVASTYECGSREARLIYEMVNYKSAVAHYINYDFTEDTGKYAAFMEIFNSHENCKCKSTKVIISDEEKNVDYSALLEKGVTGVAYKLSLGELGLVIYVNEGVAIDSVSYENVLGTTITHTTSDGTLKAKNGYYYVDGVSAANIDQIMTITVDGVSGQYCLGKYIQNTPDFDAGSAVYTYAVAAERYKNITLIDTIVSVSDIVNGGVVGNQYYVEGYYVGIADEGLNSDKEILIKDISTDDVIAVRSLGYGSFPNHGYSYGDKIRLSVTYQLDGTTNTPNKHYLKFVKASNPSNIKETVVSSESEVSYHLDNVTVLDSWADMKSFFNVKTAKAYTYVKIVGDVYVNSYQGSDGIWIRRIHNNPDATAGADIKPDSSRYLSIRDNTLEANVGENWMTDHFVSIDTDAYIKSKFDTKELYALFTGSNGTYIQLTVLDDSWFVDHDHKFSSEWTTEVPATTTSKGSEYCVCDICGIKEYRAIDEVKITSLEIVSAPARLEYTIGDVLDISGMKVIATDERGGKHDVTSKISLSKVLLNTMVKEITVSYDGAATSFAIKVDAQSTYISDIKANGVEGKLYYVEGYVAGFSQNGPGNTTETLLKDINTDDIIALTGVSYTNFAKGDRVKLYATYSVVTSSTNANIVGKQLLTYSADDSIPVSDAIVSRGNTITYKFNNVVTLSSPEDWVEFFNDATIPEYTYVRITETVFGTNQHSSNDPSGYNLQKIHTYPTDSGKTSDTQIKFDGRNVSFRDQSMELNLGDNYKNYFNGSTSTGSSVYHFSTKSSELYAIYTGANAYYFQLNILDDGWFIYEDESTYTEVDALLDIAHLFDGRGKYIHYNQTHSRRHINPSPEEATAQNQIYLDCSSFVNAVYYETFGENILPYTTGQKSPNTNNYRNYARDNVGIAEDVIGYWLCSDYKTAEAQRAILDEVKAMLEPGDILNYRKGSKGTSGHVYIYLGDGKVMHCTGSDYVDNDDASTAYDKANSTEQKSGAIAIDDISIIFDNTTHTRYLFNNQFDFCLIRPMNRGLTLTEKTVNRMKMRGADMTLSSNVGNNTAVYRGQSITYTLSVKNTSAYKRTVELSSILTDSVTYTSGSVDFAVSGNTISSTVSLAPFASYEFTWTVTVNADAEAGSLAQCNTSLGGVSLMEFRSTVSSFTEAEVALVVAKAREFAANGRTFSDPAIMVEALYNEALGVADIYSFDNTADLLASFTYLNESNGYYYLDVESELYNSVMASNLWGGFDLTYPNFYRNNDMIRLITREHISIGDATLASDDGKTVAFVYLGGADFLYIDNVTNTCSIVSMTDSPYEASNILVTFFAYDRYVTIRPSMQ